MLAPLLLLAMIQQAPLPDLHSASYLYESCKGAIRLQDDPARGTEEDISLSDACTVYIAGFLDGVSLSRVVCTDNPTMGTLARVYIAYMDKHPKQMESNRAQALFNALTDADPCRTKR
jgi:hypothetical protein